MELRHLRYFLAVADFLHFGRAAEQLRIAQPSLSHQIIQLESELQTKLFERSKKRVRLTDAGLLFLEETRQILEHVDRATVIARTGIGMATERLRIGFGYWTNLNRLCAAVKRFDQSHRNVHVELYSMSVPHQITALRENRIDVALTRPPVSDAALDSEFLLAEPFVLALPKKHRLATRKRVPISELKNEPIVMAPRETMPFFYDITLKLFKDAGFVPNVHDEVDYPSMVLGLVAAGVGVALVPASISDTWPGGVVFRSLQPSSRILETALAWRKDGLDPTLSAFLQILRDIASSDGSPRKRQRESRRREWTRSG